MHFTTLINQEDACIIVSFATARPLPPPKKNHKQRICQSCFLFYVAEGLLPFMSLLLLCLWHDGSNKADDAGIWGQFVNYMQGVDLF